MDFSGGCLIHNIWTPCCVLCLIVIIGIQLFFLSIHPIGTDTSYIYTVYSATDAPSDSQMTSVIVRH